MKLRTWRDAPARPADPDAWVVERLESWGKWLAVGNNPYGQSSLTIEEIRADLSQRFVPVIPRDCEQTDTAVRKLPKDLQTVADGLFVQLLPVKFIARRLRVTERHVWRLRDTLIFGVKYCLQNQDVKTPPLRLLLKSCQ